jgi:hypothetical protein
MLILTHYIKDNWILKLVVQSKAKQCIALLAKHIMQSHNLGEDKTQLKDFTNNDM